jgi:pimeloyl-ACP methyl ester carboxylesterase
MSRGTLAFLARFARANQDPLHERELLFRAGAEERPATAYLPTMGHPPWPGWILLQGVTVPGRHHTGVVRMARALAAAGHLALVPEVSSWTNLTVEPAEAETTLLAAADWLGIWQEVNRDRLGFMGFSVAATWMLEVAATHTFDGLRISVGVGGYADFARLLRAMLVGEHEWADHFYRYTPDPYGRWILGANLLPVLEHNEYGAQAERERAARALLELARTAGRNGALAGTPVYDPLIAHGRKNLTGRALVAWDLLASPSANPVPDSVAGRALAATLAEAGERCHPEFEVGDKLHALSVPTILLHGRHDTLVPFSEGLRLGEAIPRKMRRRVVITRLLGHAKRVGAEIPWTPAALATEIREFVRAIDALLSAIES